MTERLHADVVLFDGRQLYTLAKASPGALRDYIVGLSTPQLEGIAAVGGTPFENINPRPALKLIAAELAVRVGRRPSRERAIEAGAEVHARRRWVPLTPVLTNYSPGGV